MLTGGQERHCSGHQKTGYWLVELGMRSNDTFQRAMTIQPVCCASTVSQLPCSYRRQRNRFTFLWIIVWRTRPSCPARTGRSWHKLQRRHGPRQVFHLLVWLLLWAFSTRVCGRLGCCWRSWSCWRDWLRSLPLGRSRTRCSRGARPPATAAAATALLKQGAPAVNAVPRDTKEEIFGVHVLVDQVHLALLGRAAFPVASLNEAGVLPPVVRDLGHISGSRV